MMFLRADLGGEAMREGAIAAAALRSPGLGLAATLPGCPFSKKDWIGPGP